MIPRYSKKAIAALFSDEAKLAGWQKTELAVIEARMKMGIIPKETFHRIKEILTANPPDVTWWKAKDAELQHDLNAFIEERQRHLPIELQAYFHEHMTSYDTEEAAFALMLLSASKLVESACEEFLTTLAQLALKHRYTVMLERTHGQWAKLRTFGGRVLTWIVELSPGRYQLDGALELCSFSRISGAIGNYGGGLNPELERTALGLMGLKPLIGTTQIVPRSVYATLAQSLGLMAEALGKIALDIRLGARSGMPIYQEPFGKKQKGSSAMPHKKNTIKTEQMSGMARMARSQVLAIVSNVETWEARAIEQSSVERVMWPDLFHVVLHMFETMTKVLGGLKVYPDHMLQEVLASQGTYASDEAKNFLAKAFATRGIEANTAYRIVQLAAFNAFAPNPEWETLREKTYTSFEETDDALSLAGNISVDAPVSIQHMIPAGVLYPVDSLEATEEVVGGWNTLLTRLFADKKVAEEWDNVFRPSNLLAQEAHLFKEILDEQK